MPVWINSPLTGDQPTSLSFVTDVGWSLGQGPIAPTTTGGAQVLAGEQIRLTVSVAGATVSGATHPYPLPTPSGVVSLTVTVPAAGTVTLTPELLDSKGAVTATGASQTVNVGASGGIIVAPPPPLPPPPPLNVALAAGAVVCPQPVVINGSLPSNPADPTVGVIVEVYRVVAGVKVVDYLATPHVLGSTILNYPDGSSRIGGTFAAVFPADARTENRYYRFYLLGVLGRILLRQPGQRVT